MKSTSSFKPPSARVSVICLLTCFGHLMAGQDKTPASVSKMTPKEVAHAFLPAVVKIEVADANGKLFAEGSGFVVRPDGLVFTNYHVIEGAYSADAVLSNGDRVGVLGAIEVDTQRDFAIIKLQAVDLPVIPMGNSDVVEAGDEVVALGAPLGLSGSLSTGTVSQIRQMDERRVIQHTAAISHGSSGGPLLTMDGKVVGLNTFSLEKGNSLFFAVPVNYPRAALDSSDGKWVSLGELEKTMAKAREKEQAAEQQAFLKKNFTVYEDPDGLFSVAVPRAWHSERIQYDEESTGLRHIMTMFSAPSAEKAKMKGWLSEGIRLHMRLPLKNATWTREDIDTWTAQQFAGLEAGYSNAKASKREQIKLGKATAWEQLVSGSSGEVTKTEMSILQVLGSERGLLTVEIVSPEEQKDQLILVHDILKETLEVHFH